MITITVDFPDAKKLHNLMRYIENFPFVRAEAIAGEVADEVVTNMKDTITSSRKRPDKGTHNLENAIDWDEVKNDPGKELIIGIGNISKLNADAPYWEMIDSGFTYTTRHTFITPPIFDGEFRTFKEGSQHTIEGIDYVGKALRNLEKRLNEEVVKMGAKLIDGMSKSSTTSTPDMFGKVNVSKWGKKVRFYKEGGVDRG
jgi:hypothetical protein